MLDNLDSLEAFFSRYSVVFQPRQGNAAVADEDMYCPTCGGGRRMVITPRYSPPMSQGMGLNLAAPVRDQVVPSLFNFACSQCGTDFTVVIYKGPDGPALAILPSCRGGLTTPHTPVGVAFYLDQAHRAQAVAANSAAIAMFRGALGHLLFEQGYKTGMLGAKLAQLLGDVGAGKAPKWAMELETDFLDVLKELGNGSIHPNDGDVTRQAVLDNDLLVLVQQTFQMLLYLVYEVPHAKDETLKALRTKAQILKK